MKVVLALYPNSRGLGFACVELPKKLMDSGIFNSQPLNNRKILRQVERYLDYYKPHLVVVRDADVLSIKGRRIKRLLKEIESLAVQRNLMVHRYSRQQVQYAFQQFGAQTKYEISKQIVEWFPELTKRAPRLRKPWLPEDYSMGIFDCLALIAAHGYHET